MDYADKVSSVNPICNFWMRILAFSIDMIILSIPVNIAAFIFQSQLARMGGWERLVGFVAVVVYFGILNSHFTNGQTFGKKVTRIRVVNINGKSISIGKSFFRAAILAIPLFLNGARIPPRILVSPLGVIISGIVFGGIIGIIYFYVFNRATRQSLHDIITKTIVIKTQEHDEIRLVPIARIHYAIYGVVVFCVLTISAFAFTSATKKQDFRELIELQRQICNIRHVSYTGVFVGKTFGQEKDMQYLKVVIFWTGNPDSSFLAEKKAAEVIFNTYPHIENKDQIGIITVYGYDIGLGGLWWTKPNWKSPEQWREELNEQK